MERPSFETTTARSTLARAERPGVPVVSPRLAEPLVRQVARRAFPLARSRRPPDDSGFADFFEVSLPAKARPELAGFAVSWQTQQVGPVFCFFRSVTAQKSQADPSPASTSSSAVETGEVECFTEVD